MRLTDHLQMCNLSGQTGAMSVSIGTDSGLVYFSHGTIIHATFKDSLGEEALYRMLRRGSKTSSFEEGVSTAERSVRHSLDHILLEAARREDEDSSLPPSSVPPWARLTPISDLHQKSYLFMTTRMVLGRDPSCDIWIDNPSISKKHCSFELLDEQMMVIDLNSSNGTFINGAQITQAELQHGDLLQVGPVFVRFDSPETAPPAVVSEDKSRQTAAIQIPPLRASARLKVKLPNRMSGSQTGS